MKIVSPNRIRAARVIAVGADLLQFALFPLVFEGLLSPMEDALDLLVCAVLTCLVGWHPTFLPSFATKLAPMLDLAPTWTLAVFFATRKTPIRRPPIIEVDTEIPTRPPEVKQLGLPGS